MNKKWAWTEERKQRQTGAGNTHWKGGKQIKKGYVYIYNKQHPNATQEGYVLEHRLIMEKILGRYLERNEVVHHVNGITTDNREENLKLLDISSHPIFHNKGKASNRKGVKMSDDQKRKMSIALKGRKFTEEHKEKISQALKGRIFSEAHRQKMRENVKNRDRHMVHGRNVWA